MEESLYSSQRQGNYEFRNRYHSVFGQKELSVSLVFTYLAVSWEKWKKLLRLNFRNTDLLALWHTSLLALSYRSNHTMSMVDFINIDPHDRANCPNSKYWCSKISIYNKYPPPPQDSCKYHRSRTYSFKYIHKFNFRCLNFTSFLTLASLFGSQSLLILPGFQYWGRILLLQTL